MQAVLDATYLPFPADVVRRHFAPVRSAPDQPAPDYLRYYTASLAAAASYQGRYGTGQRPSDAATRRGRQVEKDERFWVMTALLGLYYAQDGDGRAERFGELLTRAGIDPVDGLPSWPAALAGDLHLYFEVTLPSPPAYRQWLRDNLDTRSPVPYGAEAASRAGATLEGPTKLGALLLAPATGVAVSFEAKVLSDVSTAVTYDALRNQLARNIDVLLDPNPGLPEPLTARRPERSCLVLLTPALFTNGGAGQGGGGRLYSWLLPAYRDATDPLLQTHLPHRTPDELAGAARRLGWATWEDCAAITPAACPWLTDRHTPTPAYADR